MPQVYQQRGDAETEPYWTLFQVFVGKDTVFEGTQGIKSSQITDGTSNTILVIEAVFADGSVHPIKKTIDEQNLRRLIIRNDGEIPDSDQF